MTSGKNQDETKKRTYQTYWLSLDDTCCPHCGPGNELDSDSDDGGSVVNLTDGDYGWDVWCRNCDLSVYIPARGDRCVAVRLRKYHCFTDKPSYQYVETPLDG